MRIFVLKEEQVIYNNYSLIGTFEPYRDGIMLTPTVACSLGQYLASINALYDKGYKVVYEKPFK